MAAARAQRSDVFTRSRMGLWQTTCVGRRARNVEHLGLGARRTRDMMGDGGSEKKGLEDFYCVLGRRWIGRDKPLDE